MQSPYSGLVDMSWPAFMICSSNDNLVFKALAMLLYFILMEPPGLLLNSSRCYLRCPMMLGGKFMKKWM